jgi:hypothetical protein
MYFPSESLLVLLKFAKGDLKFTKEVIDAALEVLKYCWDMFSKTATYSETVSTDNIEECLTAALDEGNSEAKQFTPAIWVTIGLWILEKVLTRVSK